MIEKDAHVLAERLRRDFPSPSDDAWGSRASPPPVQVVDCVLSLQRKYETVVLPRVTAFAARHPQLQTCAQLLDMMAGYPTPAAFLASELNTRHDQRADTLWGVLNYVLDAQKQFEGDTEVERLRAWARWCRPGDYVTVAVKGFGLAGFQYLRLLFGAHTTKPDVHIVRYVSKVLGREVTEIHALYTIERASAIVGVSARAIDSEIWNLKARP